MYVKSLLNYTGGKFSILKEIFSYFQTDIKNFIDLFAGGFNVGINVQAEKIFCNDHIDYLINLYQFLQKNSIENTIEQIKSKIKKFNLTKENLEGYNSLRKIYNKTKNIIDFFVLTCYSFNHQIRFNNHQEFNTSFGKNRSSYNSSIENNLIKFCQKLQEKNIEFSNNDFLKFDFKGLTCFDLVYCDPPYLISTGSYNDGKRGFKNWTKTEELQLLSLLNELNDSKIKFALSNIFEHKSDKNEILIDWSKKYNVHFIEKKYSNCSYHLKNRDTKTIEVLITNY